MCEKRYVFRLMLVPSALILIVILLTLVGSGQIQSNDALSWTSSDRGFSGISKFATNFERIENMASLCKDSPSQQLPEHTLLVIDKLHTIFCPVPKAGSTSWKYFFAQAIQNHSMVNASTSINIHDYGYLRHIGIRRFTDYTPMEGVEKMKSHFKLISVRHPIHRLISAYEDKILNDTWYKPHLRPYIIDRYRHGIQNKTMDDYLTMFRGTEPSGAKYLPPLPTTSPYRVQFVEFLRHVVDSFSSSSILPDVHIIPVTQLCRPCAVRYDYIAMVDTMTTDFSNILNKVQIDSMDYMPDILPRTNSNRNISGLDPEEYEAMKVEKVKTYLKEVSDPLIRRVLDIYRDDMLLFGYEWTAMEQPSWARESVT